MDGSTAIYKVLSFHSRQEDTESPREHPNSSGGQWGTVACQMLTLEHSQQCEQQLLSPIERSVLIVPRYQASFIASILKEKEPKCFQALIREVSVRHAKEAEKKNKKYCFASVWKCGNTVQTREERPLGVFELEPKDPIKENTLTCSKSFAALRPKSSKVQM